MSERDINDVDTGPEIRIGEWTAVRLADALLPVDAGTMFGNIPREEWEPCVGRLDEKHCMPVACNCLLLRNDERVILVDAGLGDTDGTVEDAAAPRLPDRLRAAGVEPADVDTVILTHLHFDHAGWIRMSNPYKEGKSAPAFPHAAHVVQQAELDAARTPHPWHGPSYRADDADALEATGLLETVDGEAEVAPGVSLLLTAAHSPGHQVVVVRSRGETLLCPCDIVPTVHHLRLPWTMSWDASPPLVVEAKESLLRAACDEEWVLFLPHEARSPFVRVGEADRAPGHFYPLPLADEV